MWLCLFASGPGIRSRPYLVGTVISMRATRTDDSSIYEIDIQYQNHVYTARLKETPARQLEWPVERPIEFRLDKRIVYLRRHNGEEA